MLGKQENEIAKAFGTILRQRRKELGLSQEQLGMEAAVNRNYISLIELGESQPTIGILFKLALALKMKPTELLSRLEDQVDAP